eukprot:CAMPEP_0170516670 /NCGR_PEP_ID=MMETSP0209-20121228/2824_1 /TAXON_ID=665100 ORGANISM="Litonotus pictus, Strain P1" /NCGR_SAMPLE_ID=MMETSP0209 /ASSEMBLY_ACC=CAM_ASM_000301 /LENGTH=427 /DNA_ID=CAMNT_0010801639 /DNA_START=427 /DNA_END=1713 /DNA_ORIENTATION=-
MFEYFSQNRTESARVERVRVEMNTPFQYKKATKKHNEHPLVCSFCSVSLSGYLLKKEQEGKKKGISNSKSNSSVEGLIVNKEVIIHDNVNPSAHIAVHDCLNSSANTKAAEVKDLNVSKFCNKNNERTLSPKNNGENNIESSEPKELKVKTARDEDRNKVGSTAFINPLVQSRFSTDPNTSNSNKEKLELIHTGSQETNNIYIESEEHASLGKEEDNHIPEEAPNSNNTNNYYNELYCGGFVCFSCSSMFEKKICEGVYSKCSTCEEYIIGFKDYEEENPEQASFINIGSLSNEKDNHNHNNNNNNSAVLQVKMNSFIDSKANNPNINTKSNRQINSFTNRIMRKGSACFFGGCNRKVEEKKKAEFRASEVCNICQHQNPSCVLPCDNAPLHKVHKACFALLLEKNVKMCPICRTALFKNTLNTPAG